MYRKEKETQNQYCRKHSMYDNENKSKENPGEFLIHNMASNKENGNHNGKMENKLVVT